jgi:Cu/Ag efflux pump CusA
VVILRSGKNARDVITAVRDKLETLKASLPEGVEIVTTYDRSQLIDRAIDNLSSKLLKSLSWWPSSVLCSCGTYVLPWWRLSLCRLACVSPLSSCTSRD